MNTLRYDRELNPNTMDKEIERIEHHNIPMSATKAVAEQVFSQNPDFYAKMQKFVEYFDSDETAEEKTDDPDLLYNLTDDDFAKMRELYLED